MQITIKQSPWQHISLQNQKQTLRKETKQKTAKKQHHLTTPGSTGRSPSDFLQKLTRKIK